jgi:cell division protein ZapA (FtsZ GTPase activity inhibitor)
LDESNPATQVVEVTVLDRHYQIRCERPELISWISQLVNDQASAIRLQSPKAELADIDVLVRVSFKLALSLYHGRKDQEALKETIRKAEARIENLAAAIDKLLPLA